MPHHHGQILEVSKFTSDGPYRILTGCYKGRTQKQVFGGVTANGELWREQQTRSLRIGGTGRINNFLSVAGQIADDKIELSNANFECHEAQDKEVDHP